MEKENNNLEMLDPEQHYNELLSSQEPSRVYRTPVPDINGDLWVTVASDASASSYYSKQLGVPKDPIFETESGYQVHKLESDKPTFYCQDRNNGWLEIFE